MAVDESYDPWPGYTKQEPHERLDTLEHKIGDARRRGDLLYARAVAIAVAAVEQLKGDKRDADLADSALNWARIIDEHGKQHLEDAGGWTPK